MTNKDNAVSIEKAAHDALRHLAQTLFDQHGIQLHSARFTWLDISSLDGHKVLVDSVAISTETRQQP